MEYKAKIKYKIKAECESHDKSVGKIKHSQHLVIREPIKDNI